MKRDNLYSVSLYLLLLLTVLSCSKDSDVKPIVAKGRTVLVYVALDNNLSNEMSAVRASLIEGWANSDIKDGSLLVFADTPGASKPMLMEIVERKGIVVYDTLRTYTNENSASPDLLKQVIADTRSLAPAKSYGMLLFSHASGWLPEEAFKDPLAWEPKATSGSKLGSRSIFEDNGREMEFDDFVEAIPDGMFDFIASEMCFMSSVETAYALRNKTKYLLAAATEVLSPGFEPIYKTSLDLLYKPKPDLVGFAQAFYDYVTGDDGVKWVAVSVVKTSEMQTLADFTRDIAPVLTQEQINKVQFYDGNPPYSGRLPHLFFDFRDYIAQVATSKEMEQLDELLDKAVIFKRNTPMLWKIRIARHSGLSVYIPQESLPRLNEAYEGTDWYRATVN